MINLRSLIAVIVLAAGELVVCGATASRAAATAPATVAASRAATSSAAARLAATGPAARLVLGDPWRGPFVCPRPARGEKNVPLRSSLYFELNVAPPTADDTVLAESVSVSLRTGGQEIVLLRPGRAFAQGASGYLRPRKVSQGLDKHSDALAVYVETGMTLQPSTTYDVRVQAKSSGGAVLGAAAGAWSFQTEGPATTQPVNFSIDLATEPVRWHGGFFTGFCNVVSCTQEKTFGPTYELMAQARKEHPAAWSYERGFWLMGLADRKPAWMTFMDPKYPNIVRERETRYITAIDANGQGATLHVEDFFGHEQYGIAAGRPLSEDYHPGDVVTVADGVHDARATVVAADDKAHTVSLDKLVAPAGGWLMDREPLPTKEVPDAPGLFAAGGCYLRKFNPHGTACYYWGRLDKEYDLAVKRYGRRVLVNYTEASPELAIDSRGSTTAKDYAQWHEVARTIADHIIERYGEKSLTFTWSVFNEPDLAALYWRSDWDELQKFYDYTSDAILRAFEDRGYDSNRVLIGGLELGAIFGVNFKITEFLAHCSPKAQAKGALPLNAAFADKRLDGKRSKRVDALCGANGGRGSPCDFVSVHAYNSSEIMAGKLIRAKEIALQLDAEYYKNLWVNSHESCPDWAPPPDQAAADSYLGNGYFESWCADVVGRQVRKAASDGRYAFGETIITIWPPVANFAGLNTFTRVISMDDHGDGRLDGKVTVACPVFHVLSLLSDMGPTYWALPDKQVGGHTVSGFASASAGGAIRVLLYTHNQQDGQSRSDCTFDVTLDLKHAGWNGAARVQQYRFDREHNTYFKAALALRDRPMPGVEKIDAAVRDLDSADSKVVRQGLDKLAELAPAIARTPAVAGSLLPAVAKARESKDESVRQAAETLIKRVMVAGAAGGEVYSAKEVDEIRKLSELSPPEVSMQSPPQDGNLSLTARLAGNGVTFIVIEPQNPKGSR